MPVLNFVFIGPGRSGTTFIDSILRQDNRISLPEKIKETNHFLNSGKESDDRFWRFFNSNCDEKAVRGEVANMYIYDAGSIPNLASMGDQLTLHSVLRNPFDRLISSLRFRLAAGEITNFTNFGETITKYPDLVEQSAYTTLLRPYLDHFGTRLKLYLFDDLMNDPEHVVRQFYRNIDLVAPTPIPSERVNRNSAQKPRSKLLVGTGRIVSDSLRNFGLLRLLGLLKDNSLVSRILYSDSPIEIDTTVWPLEVVAKLNAEIEELSQLLDKDFSHWKRSA